MKRFFLILGISGTVICSAFVGVILQNWVLDGSYTVKFINPEATGTFERMSADISFDEKDFSGSRFEVSIDVNSINLGNPDLNKQALSPDMLYSRKYPTIRFTSSSVSAQDNRFLTKGVLELHGIKKEIEIPFTFQNKTFKGGFEIKAKEYGITSLGNGPEDILKIELTVPVKEK